MKNTNEWIKWTSSSVPPVPPETLVGRQCQWCHKDMKEIELVERQDAIRWNKYQNENLCKTCQMAFEYSSEF